MKVLIVDQFSGVTPYALREHPIKFDDLVAEALAAGHPWTKPKVIDVDDNFKPALCTTVVRADANGMAEVWRYNWDTSG